MSAQQWIEIVTTVPIVLVLFTLVENAAVIISLPLGRVTAMLSYVNVLPYVVHNLRTYIELPIVKDNLLDISIL
jgi:hypothetical protein